MMFPSLDLEAKSLACERGGRLIFKDLSFAVASGEAMAVRGANGSGKSSLLRLLAGLNQPVDGTVSLNGSEQPFPELAHYVGHAEALKTSLTVWQNLEFWTRFLGGTPVRAALDPFRLQKLADDDVRLLSEGQRRRLALSRLVAVKRPLWLLDEPTVGLDQQALADLRREMTTHLKEGGLILAATHAEFGLPGIRTLNLEGES
jgi:heme exporter protein A